MILPTANSTPSSAPRARRIRATERASIAARTRDAITMPTAVRIASGVTAVPESTTQGSRRYSRTESSTPQGIMRARMDLNEIVVFARVVETGSFTAAGQALGLPKSTVSRKIAQLEERLDARLLQRTTRKLNLTEVGRAY